MYNLYYSMYSMETIKIYIYNLIGFSLLYVFYTASKHFW